MTDKSSKNGKAYEFALLKVFNERVKYSKIIEDSSFKVAQSNFYSLEEKQQINFLKSAETAFEIIIDFEPNLIDDLSSKDFLLLSLQDDTKGKEGDVRDLLITRKDISWEIGISAKNNHFAVKHSRLSSTLNFGREWYGIPCSEEYWNKIEPIFEYTDEQKSKNLSWKELGDDKVDRVYSPLLKAFIGEIKWAYSNDPHMVTRMVEYLVGKFDFYKSISIDKKRETHILAVNIKGELNKKSRVNSPIKKLNKAILPTELIDIRLKPNNDTTVEMYFNNGWQFSFRIHNAKTKVENSLKFDIQPISYPSPIIEIIKKWENKNV
ncbi:MAG: HaeIII family restriction endonuclease [Erysipelotrichales bacterium]|nr:HaeIII family restriction endonuclease [Erysipelotrichales bacterium]MCL2676718.1 HaeIII family restriction endonuclease [Streptococcaceae bacterium]